MIIYTVLSIAISLHALGLTLHKGWNLVGSSFNDINISKTIPNADISWVFRDNKWHGYSENIQYKNAFNDKFDGVVKRGEGFWAYTSSDLNKTVAYNNLLLFRWCCIFKNTIFK